MTARKRSGAPCPTPDLLVLDLMLPKVDGLQVCRKLRERWPVPVIMLTALGEEIDRVVGLETGADDYVTKPFSPRELALRVQSVLRRARGASIPAGTGVLRDGELVVDVGAHEVRLGDEEIMLTAREFDLLAHLMRNPARPSAVPPCSTRSGDGPSATPPR
nr:hypothetical protein GCM10020093_077030 [Planobispora longispora]